MTERLVIKVHNPLRHLTQRVLLALLAAALGGALYLLGSRNAGYAHAEAGVRVDQLQAEVARLSAEREALQARFAVLGRGAQVDQEAATVILEKLRGLQTTNLELREAVAFYQGIVAPKHHKNGLEVQAMQVTGNQQTGAYHYRLVLTQVTRSRSKARGKLGLRISGAQDGRPVSYSLAELSPEKIDKRKFRFRYFQQIEGDWVLPKGFSPQTVRVLLAPYKRDKVERSLSWDEVFRSATAG